MDNMFWTTVSTRSQSAEGAKRTNGLAGMLHSKFFISKSALMQSVLFSFAPVLTTSWKKFYNFIVYIFGKTYEVHQSQLNCINRSHISVVVVQNSFTIKIAN